MREEEAAVKILIDVDDATGNLQLVVEPQNTPAPIVSWILRKAEAAVFNPPPAPPKVRAVPGAALRHLPGLNGEPR